MVEVIDFPKTKDYKILFALPPGGKVRINKTSEDIELEITKNYGTAFIKAKSKQKTFLVKVIVEIH